MSVLVSGSAFVRADRATVWTALHDVAVISLCLPGCRSLSRESETTYRLTLLVGFGPVRLAFDGVVEISESDPPSRYCLVGRGATTYAGSGVGRATITLRDQPRGCSLAYAVEATVKGPIVLTGSRVQNSVGKAIAAVFASRLGETLGESANARLLPVIRPDQVSATRRR